MTDIAYRCHNCGSMHEVESIRENLLLDLRPAASYQAAASRGTAETSQRIRRWRMTYGFAQAIWPRDPQAVSRESSRWQPLVLWVRAALSELNGRLEVVSRAAGRKAKVVIDAKMPMD